MFKELAEDQREGSAFSRNKNMIPNPVIQQ